MVRITVEQRFDSNKKYIEAAGVALDSKPTDGIVTGSLFLEVDTGDVYAFEEGDSPTWNKICELGGSGS